MNKIVTTGPAWLASDIHLGPDNPKTAQLFFEFLDQAGAHAGALFLLGDIFDVWIGDDWINDPPHWLAQAIAQLERTAQRVPLYLGHGNRDFLMGKRLAAHLGAHLLDEQCILQTGGKTALLAHGDEFCTTDRTYQRFRTIVRHGLVQRLYLSLPIKQRLSIALHARKKSMQSQTKHKHIWHDVSLSSINAALARAGTRTLIHGHTHRPGHYVDNNNGQMIDRWVLPDWEADHLDSAQSSRGGWLVINNEGLTLFDVQGKTIKK